jgi:plasmid maintenance system antidote protein VapI
LKRTQTSQSAFAVRLQVSRVYVTQIVNARRQPSLDVAARIEKLTGIPSRDFAQVA